MQFSPRTYFVFLLSCWLVAFVAPSALAGPNVGGTVTLHWNDSTPYTSEPQYFSGGLTDCAASIVQVPPVSTVPPPEDEMRIWFAYAVFPPGSLPRLVGVSFGIGFSPLSGDHGLSILWTERAPETIEFPTPGWPVVSNSGNVLVFKHAQTSEVVQLYLFAGYATDGQYFSLRKHPSIPSQFADDTIPPDLDDIADFGSLGFGVEGRRACPAPALGACCLPDGGCLHVSPVDCLRQGGAYQGNETSCELVSCPQPRGACCFEDGHCELQAEARCVEYGGAWFGSDAACEPNPCPQPPPPGACCFEDGHCAFVLESACFTGDWREWVTCLPNPCPGACCDRRDGSCELQSETECEFHDDSYHTWLGMNHCDPNPCLVVGGACCLLDGSCIFVLENDCPTGRWLTTDCHPYACPPGPTGACCSMDGGCVIATQGMCHRYGDNDHWWDGPNTSCDPNPCSSPPPWGACCYYLSGCSVTLEMYCPAGSDWYVGSTCDPDPCHPPEGACCYANGSCEYLTGGDCLTGDWREGVPCAPNPCPQVPGACCHPDGSCTFTMEPECDGIWLGYNSVCLPNRCPQPAGACCLPSGECVMTSELDCTEGQHGVFRGAFVPCIPSPCVTPAERTSWGRIKTRFR